MNYVTTFCLVLLSATTYADEPFRDGTVRLQLGSDQALVFRRVSPGEYGIDYPDFYMLETEVTNAQYKAYLDATSKTKDDTEVLKIVRQREESRVFNTGDIPYSIEDATTIWRDEEYPDGLGDHPVALVTLHDAHDFAKWLTQSNAEAGLFRLPTWNEWMIAAYGSSRNYPWGMEWDSKRAHTSYGIEDGFSATLRGEPNLQPKRTGPVTARPNGRTPEGIYGLMGNVSEYILTGDPTNRAYFNLGSRFMGGGFKDGCTSLDDDNKGPGPRKDYWGYSHHATPRKCDLGFRVVLDPTKNTDLYKRERIFRQRNRAWMVEDEDGEGTTPKQTTEPKQEAVDWWKIRTFKEYLELYRKQGCLRLPGFVCNSPSDTTLFQKAVRHLESDNKDELTVACLLIESLNHPRRVDVVEMLIPLLKHDSFEIRRAVASALRFILCYSDDPGLPKLYREKVIGPVLERLRVENDDDVLTSLVYVLSGHKWDDVDVTSALASLLQRDPPLGEPAMLVLIRCMRWVPPPRQKHVARSAALKLVEILKDKRRDKSEQAGGPFAFLKQGDEVRVWRPPSVGLQIRFEAARLLGRLGVADPFVIDALITALKDRAVVDFPIPSSSQGAPAPQERRTIAGAAAESLGWIGPPGVKALPALERVLPTIEEETDESVRSASVLQVYPTRTDYLRCVGAITLIDTKRTDLMPVIVALLDARADAQTIPRMHVRRVAVSLLGRIGKRASPALDDLRHILRSEREVLKSGECLKDDQEKTVRLIEEAIERICCSEVQSCRAE